MTALHWAVERGCTQTVELLLKHGANTNIESKFDKTVLGIAYSCKLTSFVNHALIPGPANFTMLAKTVTNATPHQNSCSRTQYSFERRNVNVVPANAYGPVTPAFR